MLITRVHMSQPRVLFISPQPFYQWRGSPIRVAFAVQAIAELGYDVDLLTLPIGEDRSIDGVRVLRVGNPFGVRNVPIGPSIAKLIFDWLLLIRARSLVKQNRYAVVHAVEDAGMIGVYAARRGGARAIFEKHSDPASHRKGVARNAVMALYGRVETSVIRRAAAVIGTGPGLVEQARATGTRASLHQIFDIPSSRVEPDSDAVHSARASMQSADDNILITYVGSFAVYQGIDLMFDVVPRVVRANEAARFVIIGGSPAEIEERRKILASQGVADRVTFLGKIDPDELTAYLAASDILLSPRISGSNTPLKLLDYLKAGRSIAATDIEANRLILNEDVAVFAGADTASYATAIEKLCSDATLREQVARSGRRLIDEQYNYQNFREQLRQCYDAVLARA